MDHRAPDRASPNFIGLASLGLEIGIFCGFLYSVLLLSVILGLDYLGLALSPGRRFITQKKSELVRIDADTERQVSRYGTEQGALPQENPFMRKTASRHKPRGWPPRLVL